MTAPTQTGTGTRTVALFVLGMPRSGTSALTRVLSLCGATLPAELSFANRDNPRGSWEPRAAIELNEAILYRHGSHWMDPTLRLQEQGAFDADDKAASVAEIRAFLSALPAAPLVVIKDPIITVLSGLWFEAARLCGLDVAAAIAVRHPHEVFSSNNRLNNASPELTGAAWMKYSLLAERHTRGLPRVVVDYANLLDDWRREIKRISAALAIDLSARDEGAVEAFLTPELRHERHGGSVTELFDTDWMSTVYGALSAAARDEPWDDVALDRVFEAYRSEAYTPSRHGFRTAFEDFSEHFKGMRLRSTADADAQKFAREHLLLLAELERNPQDARLVVSLADGYFDWGDFASARKWYARRAEMGGPDQEVYYAKYRVADSMAELGEPWPDVQDAYLRAWAFRPTRAEALFALAQHYRVEGRYQLGYLFAQRAAQIPLPEEDTLFVQTHVYTWAAIDEQAICASWICKHAETITLCRTLLARPDIPEDQRQRIAVNRDVSVPAMVEASSSYPDVLVGSLAAGPRGAEVTVSLVAWQPDHAATEQTLNSFLNCCTDVSQIGRFVVFDAGLSSQDRARLQERYRFVEFVDCGPAAQLGHIREQIGGRFWLHLGQGWRFFAPDNFVTRLTAVLEAEPQVFQVGINFADAVKTTGACAAEQSVRRAPGAGQYVLSDVVAGGPAMFDTTRLDRAGGMAGIDPDRIAELGQRAAAVGQRTATLDEVLCIASTAARWWRGRDRTKRGEDS